MKRLPRSIPDIIRLWSDLAHHPRETLLNRCHHQWRGAGFIAVTAVLVASGAPGFGVSSLTFAALIAGPGWALDVAGTLAHELWEDGRIWQDIDCQCCGGNPGDGDDETDPDEPADDGGLGLTDRDIETWLNGQPTPTR
ncbi:hypothetical protein [Streptomyces sp. NBC_01022]|uniref:hypothetical protein n=1 Tax=Streptomyces sp. NBC_01022 TaxID=2903723 RepID=UPI002DDC4888|nr:hypothetical protein [Streptomyces sp. NBC_01022]WRZ84833.1 hypothetical protein OG316_33520 [Streptomyces sp. NBC_01022]